MINNKSIGMIIACISLLIIGFFWYRNYRQISDAGENTVTQDVGGELEKNNLIRISGPLPYDTITDPVLITGEARGMWYFEASFPVRLIDGRGRVIAESYAQAQGEWMTEDFVPFQGVLRYRENPSTPTGTLILEKDNPSGLPEHADELRVPIRFGQ